MQRQLAARGMIPAAGGSGAAAAAQARHLRGGAALEAELQALLPAAAPALPSGSGTSAGAARTPLAGLQCMLPMLHLFVGCQVLLLERHAPPGLDQQHIEAQQPRIQWLLSYSQVLLDLEPSCAAAFRPVATLVELLLDPFSPQRLPHILAMLECGIAVAKRANCECQRLPFGWVRVPHQRLCLVPDRQPASPGASWLPAAVWLLPQHCAEPRQLLNHLLRPAHMRIASLLLGLVQARWCMPTSCSWMHTCTKACLRCNPPSSSRLQQPALRTGKSGRAPGRPSCCTCRGGWRRQRRSSADGSLAAGCHRHASAPCVFFTSQ